MDHLQVIVGLLASVVVFLIAVLYCVCTLGRPRGTTRVYEFPSILTIDSSDDDG